MVRHGAAVENFAKQGQTAGIFWPKLLAATIAFAGIDVEPTMKLAAATVAWEAATKIEHFTPRIGGVAGGVWRFATSQLGGAHALARISGFPVYLRLYFRIFCFRTFVVFSCYRYPTSFFIVFPIFTVFYKLEIT